MSGPMSRLAEHRWVLLAGLLMGGVGSALAYLGNPANSGICISCFLENAAGAVGLHGNPRMQYIRPELLGFFLGSFGAALVAREFRPRGQGVGASLFGFGFLMMVGSAVFIGCPIKAVLRLAAGDLTSVPGLVGLVLGVWAGVGLLRRVDLGGGARPVVAPLTLPLGAVGVAALLTGLAFVPGALRESSGGGGALHAARPLSLAAGLVLGMVCQRSRFCITGSIRDFLLTRSAWPAAALGAAIGAALLTNFFTGQFSLGYYDQPGSHLDALWSALGMGLVGVVAVVAGGCPFRQIIRAGEGDLDALSVTLGMVCGAALVQLWGLGANAEGVPPGGRIAVLLGLAAVCSLALHRGENRK
ncbi:MAG: YedE family putative selenium transporter [Deferrisomatales bacterium]|nr:YedE family putative selenium transporter [Deferrisomatales bacterium]